MVAVDQKKISIDTMILVYLLEDSNNLGKKAEKILSSAKTVHASILCHLEVAVGYFKTNDTNNLNDLTLLAKLFSNFHFVPVDMVISLEAARLRAHYPSLKTPDSIHLATALVEKADYFITDDKRLNKIKEIRVLTIDEIEV